MPHGSAIPGVRDWPARPTGRALFRHGWATPLAAAALVLVALAAVAEDEAGPGNDGSPPAAEPSVRAPEPSLEGGVPARPIEPVSPKYPSSAAMRMQEGWVQLSFVVGADGTVQSPVVEDSSGVPAFEKAALSAIQRTRYQPATWQGKPIEQCATQFRYVFLINSPRLGARESFIHEFKEVNRLTTEQKMDEAEEKLLAMTEKGTWSNYESARLWLMRAGIQQKKGDQAGELRSLERATMVGGRFLEPELYRAALQEKFRLQAKLMKFRDALDTYDRIKALKPPIDNASIEKAAGDIQAAIQSPDLLSFPGVVEYRSGCEEGRANWKHELLRRKFAFDAVEGNVEDFQLRCDWKLVSDKFSVEKTWQVPASWGYCQVFVFGDVGAKFKLLEYPQQADASP